MAKQRQVVMNAINAGEFSIARDIDGHLVLKDNRFPFQVVCVTCHLEARELDTGERLKRDCGGC